MQRRRRSAARHLALLLAGGLAACAAPPEPAERLLEPAAAAARAEQPLGGQSLAQRRHELERARAHLAEFRATLRTLRQRRDRSGRIQFQGFVRTYMREHLEPLLAPEWLSEHPELLGLDAGTRLLQAEVYLLLGDDERMERVVEEIERRFSERDSMLVDYPLEEQSTLREALEHLAHRKWWG